MTDVGEFLTNARRVCRYLPVNGKNGSDGDEAVDVGGAVQRIEAHDVFTLK